MRPAGAVSLTLTSLVMLVTPAGAQTRFGVAAGRSLVGSGGSRVLVPAQGELLTGAGAPGWFAAAHVESSIGNSAFSVRGELSASRLGSSRPEIAFVGGDASAPTASRDLSLGLSGSLVAATSRTATLAPYAIGGMGWYVASLRATSETGTGTLSASGNGLGLQLGGGLRWQRGAARIFVETRLVQPLSSVRGVNYMPLMVGVQF
jgi:hypothetical protein